MSELNDDGRYTWALYAVLNAAKDLGVDTDKLVQSVRENISHKSFRPSPQHQESVIRTIEGAIKDLADAEQHRQLGG